MHPANCHSQASIKQHEDTWLRWQFGGLLCLSGQSSSKVLFHLGSSGLIHFLCTHVWPYCFHLGLVLVGV
jgi:hypothetical protein